VSVLKSGRHAVPDGQPPLQVENGDPLHDPCHLHSQNCPKGSTTQVSFGGQSPRHSGTGALVQGC
jgi:hypothetical protein